MNTLKVLSLSFFLIFSSSLWSADTSFIDTTTGLEWQIQDEPKRHSSWEDAINYCHSLPKDEGKTRWRLPNINELFTLVEFSGNPYQADNGSEVVLFIKEELLGSTLYGAYLYWSSTISLTQERVQVIDFSNGISAIRSKVQTDPEAIDRYITRCVRG